MTHLLPKLELRLPRVSGEFVATFTEKAAGHIWEYGGGSGWQWISQHIADGERAQVEEQIRRAIAKFKRCGKSDAGMLDVVFGSEETISDDDYQDAVQAAHRANLCLRAVRDLEEVLASMSAVEVVAL